MADLTPVQVELVARAHLVAIGAEAPKVKRQQVITKEAFERSLESKPTVADYARAQREQQKQKEQAAMDEAKRKIAEAEREMGFCPG